MTVAVLTRSYDNARTGTNAQESVLTPDAVAHRGLKKLFSLHITDDQRGAEAQPLLVPNLTMPDGQPHDVVYVCSMANTVWAFDANTGQMLWANPASLGTPIKNTKGIDIWLINDHWGILSTPVIDLPTQTMYLVSYSSPHGTQQDAVQRLHALRLTDGQPVRPPVVINASMPNAHGGQVHLSANQKQRAALLLVPPGDTPAERKTLYFGYTGGEHPGSPHGWLVAFEVPSLRQIGAVATTPNSWGGGIWQGSQGPSADQSGAVFVMTGNGGWDGHTDFAESFIKLQADGQGLRVVDWFTPFTDALRQPPQLNHRGYDWSDQDLGSAGPIVLEDEGLLVGAGKDGVLYVADRAHLGQTSAADLAQPSQNYAKLKSRPIFFTYFPGFNRDPAPDDPQGLNFFGPDNKTHHLHGSPVFWRSPDHGPMLFCWGENENLRAWTISASGAVRFLAKGAEVASAGDVGPAGHGGMPGGMLCLSANGQQPHTGIVWTLSPIAGDANSAVVRGILRAYDATRLDSTPNADGSPRLGLLWDSQRLPGNTFNHNKFGVPVVSGGKVYVPTYDGRVDVYGLA